jgi:hypothetical protein
MIIISVKKATWFLLRNTCCVEDIAVKTVVDIAHTDITSEPENLIKKTHDFSFNNKRHTSLSK